MDAVQWWIWLGWRTWDGKWQGVEKRWDKRISRACDVSNQSVHLRIPMH